MPGDETLRLAAVLGSEAAEALETAVGQRNRIIDLAAPRWVASGYSGAVLAAVVETSRPPSPARPRKYVVKVCPADGRRREGARHHAALEMSPDDFADRHLVPMQGNPIALPSGGEVLLQNIAGGSLAECQPMSDYSAAERLRTATEVVRALTGTWTNERTWQLKELALDGFIRDGLAGTAVGTGADLAHGLGIDPALLDVGAEWIETVEDGSHMPLANPLALLDDSRFGGDGDDRVQYIAGFAHCDLHEDNILVPRVDGTVAHERFLFVDLSTFDEAAPLSCDLAMLAVSAIVRRFSEYSDEQREALLHYVVDRTAEQSRGLLRETALFVDTVRYAARPAFIPVEFDGNWTEQLLLSLLATALLHLTFESLDSDARWWLFRLAAHTGTRFLRARGTVATEVRRTIDRTAVMSAPLGAHVQPGQLASPASTPAPDRATAPEHAGDPYPTGQIESERGSFQDELEGLKPFALPSVSRLDLISRAIDGAGAVPGQIWFIVGEGGLGKSVLLGQLAGELVRGNELAPDSDPGPESGSASGISAAAVVLVACDGISGSADVSDVRSADIAFAEAARVHRPSLPTVSPPKKADPHPSLPADGLRSLLQSVAADHPNVFLLVDALDVVLSEDTVEAITTVLADAARDAQLFLTCRTREFEDLLQDPRTKRPRLGNCDGDAVLMPVLAAQEIIEWASAYVDGLERSAFEKSRFVDSLSDAVSAATVREVCAVPLRLALACDLYSSGTTGVPTDLTITGLLLTYWEQRICRDRKGRRTNKSRAQEAAALTLAKAIWEQSTERLSLTVDVSRLDVEIGMRALVSEGVVRQQAGRNEFFHQGFAEFAVARWLLQKADAAELEQLRAGLADAHSFLWPVARHLLLQDASTDRYQDVAAAVPRLVAEGAQDHLLAALARKSPDLLQAHVRIVGEHDRGLLHSLVQPLTDAPDPCVDTALGIVIPMLAEGKIADSGVTEAARTAGVLIARADTSRRAGYLATALDLVASRVDSMSRNRWLNLPKNLVIPVCSAGPDAATTKLLCERYIRLGVGAQRVFLQSGLESSGPGGQVSPLWPTVAAAMLSAELPSDLPSDVVGRLMRQCWLNYQVRKDQGWTDWRDMLQARLPARWDMAQVRLLHELCDDPLVRRQLLSELLGGEPLTFGDRWVNAARFIANSHADEVVAMLCTVRAPLGRGARGALASLAMEVADGALDRTTRERLVGVLQQFVTIDARRIWPALIATARNEADLHEPLLAAFMERDREVRELRELREDGEGEEIGDDGEARDDDEQASWETARASAVKTWINVAPTSFLLQAKEQIRALLLAKGVRATVRRADFEGRIALHDEQAREWLDAEVRSGDDHASAADAVRSLHRAIREDPVAFTPDQAEWLASLLSTRHSTAAQYVAVMLADETLVHDLLIDPAVVVDRLRAAADRREESQLITKLIDLLIRLDDASPLPTEAVRSIVQRSTEPVLEFADRLHSEHALPVSTRARMTTDVSQWVKTVGSLGMRRLPIGELEATVRGALTGWDAHELGKGVSRVLATIMQSLLVHSPEFALWLTDELWPNSEAGTKTAIADAFIVHERKAPTHHALELARRSDCPAELAGRIHRLVNS
ncbi:hypothetical protein ABH935_009973 [Catenulispora sp. GAS73]|uniref:hypothetical protein n=1 Tax=Catenulispora sp. GAS73 TaxID=3156269 RepID=UPI00351870A3